MTLNDLLEGHSLPFTVPDCQLTGLSSDSRTIRPGDLFVATSDSYVDDAIRRGAVAVLKDGGVGVESRQGIPVISMTLSPDNIARTAARFHDWPTQHMRIIGVTGTSGKTSCTQFLASAFRQLSEPCGVVGTLGFGTDETLQPFGLTTPDAVTLQSMFAQFLKQGVKRATMEVSSHALHQQRVAGIPFSVGVFTNLSRDHLDYHGDMATYGAEKKKLFLQSALAVINANDEFGRSLLPMPRTFIACGTDRIAGPFLESLPADRRLIARHIRSVDGQFSADVATPWGSGTLSVPLPGFFNFENALLVLATLCAEGVAFDKAIACIESLKPVPGRMQIFGGQGRPWVIVDYAHKPDALRKVLASLREQYQGGRLYCVFGCGGDRDQGKRPVMGEIATRFADRVILTDDNPRYEDPAIIIEDIRRGIPEGVSVTVIHDRYEAIKKAIYSALPGECILVAGKGAETTQTTGDRVVPFSDAAVVSSLLQEYAATRTSVQTKKTD